MFQIHSKVNQYALKKNNFCCTNNAKSPTLDKPLPLNSIVLHRTFKAPEVSDELEPVHNGPFKTINKPTEVMY